MQLETACLSLGIDIGSTTIKYALVDSEKKIIASRYERHKSDVAATKAAPLRSAFRVPGHSFSQAPRAPVLCRKWWPQAPICELTIPS